ncbi:MAG TPA: hypothetical protein VMH41_08025 [Mycobacteriales bacterium]|nr:hypothetical protein [Mycobacteriales bacterium]
MRSRRGFAGIGALAVLGILLLAYGAVQAARGEVLGGFGITIVVLGLALVVAAGTLTIVMLSHPSEPAPPTEPALAEPATESDHEPAVDQVGRSDG